MSEDQVINAAASAPGMSLLIVDDDENFCQRLAGAMSERGFDVTAVTSLSAGLEAVSVAPPAFAVIDLRIADSNGLDLMSRLKDLRPDARAIMLTGYGNITTAVTAVHLGAFDYLAKPVDADEISRALTAAKRDSKALPDHLMSANDARLGHIQSVYATTGKNVSETARRLGMHRRTLQRIFHKSASPVNGCVKQAFLA